LIGDKADLLVGPYGTAATMMAAAEAESARRVMVNGAGPSRTVHKRSPRYVFQTAVPYNAYGSALLDLAREHGAKSAFVISRAEAVLRACGLRSGAPSPRRTGRGVCSRRARLRCALRHARKRALREGVQRQIRRAAGACGGRGIRGGNRARSRPAACRRPRPG